jgi:hypothetical protein
MLKSHGDAIKQHPASRRCALVKKIARSDAKQPAIPIHSSRCFRRKPATDSDPFQPPLRGRAAARFASSHPPAVHGRAVAASAGLAAHPYRVAKAEPIGSKLSGCVLGGVGGTAWGVTRARGRDICRSQRPVRPIRCKKARIKGDRPGDDLLF